MYLQDSFRNKRETAESVTHNSEHEDKLRLVVGNIPAVLVSVSLGLLQPPAQRIEFSAALMKFHVIVAIDAYLSCTRIVRFSTGDASHTWSLG